MILITMIWNLLMISFIICFIVDISGIIESIESALSKWLKGKAQLPKPFNCSLCLTFWVGLIYVICVDCTLFNVLLVCVVSALTEVITNTIIIVREMICWVYDKIMELITKY